MLTYYHPHWTGLTVYRQADCRGPRRARPRRDGAHDARSSTARCRPEEDVGGVRVVRVPTIGRLSRTAMLMPTFPVGRPAARSPRTTSCTCTARCPRASLLVSRRWPGAAGRPLAITHQGDVVMPAGLRNRVGAGWRWTGTLRPLRCGDADGVVHPQPRLRRALAACLRTRAPCLGSRRSTPPIDRPGAGPGRASPTLRGRARSRRRARCRLRRPLRRGEGLRRAARGDARRRRRRCPACASSSPARPTSSTSALFERLRDRRGGPRSRRGIAPTVGLLLDRQRLADFYALCDVFVLPSRSDCFASVQVESLRSGTPLVASDIPGLRTVVRSTGMGRLVPTGDPGALAAALAGGTRRPPAAADRGRGRSRLRSGAGHRRVRGVAGLDGRAGPAGPTGTADRSRAGARARRRRPRRADDEQRDRHGLPPARAGADGCPRPRRRRRPARLRQRDGRARERRHETAPTSTRSPSTPTSSGCAGQLGRGSLPASSPATCTLCPSPTPASTRH